MAISYSVTKEVAGLLATKEWLDWKDGYDRQAVSGLEEPDPFGRCQSPSLRLGSFVRIGQEERRKGKDKYGNPRFEKYAARGSEVSAIVACCNRCQVPSRLGEVFQRVPGVIRVLARTRSRLIVNQAGGVIENAGLCLHPHFGYPFIPGSSVKGVARHAAWSRWLAAKQAGDVGLAHVLARKIVATFGFPTNDKGLDYYVGEDADLRTEMESAISCSGSVTFLSAEPIGRVELEADILTPHGSGNPIPNAFPVVKADQVFMFGLVPVRKQQALFADVDTLAFARESLEDALEGEGLGAKTAAGYGWFEILTDEAGRKFSESFAEDLSRRRDEQEEEVAKFLSRVAVQNVDWKTVQPDAALMDELSALGQKPILKLFRDDNERLMDPVYCRTLFEICVKGRHQILWARESTKNSKGPMAGKMTEWAKKFGEKL